MPDKKETIVEMDAFKKEREFVMSITNTTTGDIITIDEGFIKELQTGDIDLNDDRCKFLLKGMMLEYIELLVLGLEDET